MNTLFENLITFTGLVVGVPVALSHQLMVNGMEIIPNVFALSDDGFEITGYTSSTITVVRTTSLSGSVTVWVRASPQVGTKGGVVQVATSLGAVLVDGVTIAGDGVVTALSVIPTGLADEVPVATDGITATGNGTIASPIRAVGSSGSTIYFNAAVYGAVGDGTTNNTPLIQAAINAAASAGGGTVWLPDASVSYLIRQFASSAYCLNLPGNVSLLGQSRANALLFLAAGTAASVRPLQLSGSNYSVSQLTIDGNKANQSVDEHRANIFCNSPTQVVVDQVELRNATGDGIDIWQNTTDFSISNVYAHDNVRNGIGLDAQGQSNISITNFDCQNNGSQIHIEPGGALGNIWIANGILSDGANGVGNPTLEISGASSTNVVSNVTVRNVAITGITQVLNAQNVMFDSVSWSNGTTLFAIKCSLFCQNVKFQKCQVTLTSACTAAQGVWLAGNNTAEDAVDVEWLDSYVIVQCAGNVSAIELFGLNTGRVRGGAVIGNASATGVGILVDSTFSSSSPWDSCDIVGVTIDSFPTGVKVIGASSSDTINDFNCSECYFTSQTASGVMTYAMDLDSDGHHVITQATAIGNRTQPGAGITTFKTYPHGPLLIGGDWGGIEILSVATSPAGVVTAPIGSQAIERDNGTTWINATGASSGWHSVNVT